MTCCIVGLLIMAGFGRIRRLFGGRGPEPVLFAPVAYRPAPGEEMPPAPVAVTETPGARADSPVLRYCAVGIALWLLAAPALAAAGVLDNTGSALLWTVRTAGYAAALAATIALSRSVTIWRAPRGAGTLLIVVGAIIFELSVLDMHVFGLFTIDRTDLVAMTVFHNIGPAVAIVGGAILAYGSRGRSSTSSRSSRSTVTSAQPVSSAVTLSSTPPVMT